MLHDLRRSFSMAAVAMRLCKDAYMKTMLSATTHAVICLIILSGGFALRAAAKAAPAGAVEKAAGDAVTTKDDGGTTKQDLPYEPAPKEKIFGLETGYNGSYSEGTAPSNYYSQPYLNCYLKHKYIKFTAGISRLWDYQISNGSGKFETVNITQPMCALSLYPHRVIELYGEYRYWTGDKSHYYKTHEGTAGFELNVDIVSLGMSANYAKTEYKFKSDDGEVLYNLYSNYDRFFRRRAALYLAYLGSKKRSIQHTSGLELEPTFSIQVHETTSLDLGYTYQNNGFEYLVIGNRKKFDEYMVHSGKIGITSEPASFFSLFADVSIGADSQNYLLAGGDLGIAFTILEYVRISGSYNPIYYDCPPPKILGHRVSRSFMRVRELWAMNNLIRWRRINPYLKSSDIAKSFWTHGVSVGASFTY